MPFNLFGRGQKAPTTEEAINKLAETENMLAKKSEFIGVVFWGQKMVQKKNQKNFFRASKNDHFSIEKQMNDELKKAKTYGTANKRAALQCLKKKKRLEKQLEQVDNTGFGVGKMIASVTYKCHGS